SCQGIRAGDILGRFLRNCPPEIVEVTAEYRQCRFWEISPKIDFPRRFANDIERLRDSPSSLFETFENPLSHEIQTQNQHLTGRKTAVGRHTIRIRVISHPIRASYWREEEAPPFLPVGAAFPPSSAKEGGGGPAFLP